ncbi:MAG: hypothetical protein AAFR79_14100 [Pseudomonadota bacterium]
MTDNVVYLHASPPRPREIAQVIRIGFFDHLKAEHLISTHKLAARRFVIDAGNVERQANLVRTLRNAGAEIVLDTKVAELSAPGSASGSARHAPWAASGRLLEAADLIAGTNRSVIEPIARFAVAHGFTAVMAPSHYLGDTGENWLGVDLRSAVALRSALDREGGADVALDFPVILRYAQLRDPAMQRRLIEAIADLPDGHVWLRVSGFGADATGTGMARFIEACHALRELGRPIIVDHLGGLASLATSAFGAVSGYAHGLEGKSRFDAREWLKPPSGGGGGGPKRLFLAGLDRSMKIAELRSLFDKSRTARTIFGCADTTCCADVEKMLANPEAHMIVQHSRATKALSAVPETMRPDRFLSDEVEMRLATAERAKGLKSLEAEHRKAVETSAVRLERVRDALRGHYKRHGQPDFAPEAPLRTQSSGAGPDKTERERPS